MLQGERPRPPDSRFYELEQALQDCKAADYYPATEHYLHQSLIRQSGTRVLERLNVGSFDNLLHYAIKANKIAPAGEDKSGIRLFVLPEDAKPEHRIQPQRKRQSDYAPVKMGDGWGSIASGSGPAPAPPPQQHQQQQAPTSRPRFTDVRLEEASQGAMSSPAQSSPASAGWGESNGWSSGPASSGGHRASNSFETVQNKIESIIKSPSASAPQMSGWSSSVPEGGRGFQPRYAPPRDDLLGRPGQASALSNEYINTWGQDSRAGQRSQPSFTPAPSPVEPRFSSTHSPLASRPQQAVETGWGDKPNSSEPSPSQSNGPQSSYVAQDGSRKALSGWSSAPKPAASPVNATRQPSLPDGEWGAPRQRPDPVPAQPVERGWSSAQPQQSGWGAEQRKENGQGGIEQSQEAGWQGSKQREKGWNSDFLAKGFTDRVDSKNAGQSGKATNGGLHELPQEKVTGWGDEKLASSASAPIESKPAATEPVSSLDPSLHPRSIGRHWGAGPVKNESQNALAPAWVATVEDVKAAEEKRAARPPASTSSSDSRHSVRRSYDRIELLSLWQSSSSIKSPPAASSPSSPTTPKPLNPHAADWFIKTATKAGVRVGPASPPTKILQRELPAIQPVEPQGDVTPPERQIPPAPTSSAVKPELQPKQASWTGSQLNAILHAKAPIEEEEEKQEEIVTSQPDKIVKPPAVPQEELSVTSQAEETPLPATPANELASSVEDVSEVSTPASMIETASNASTPIFVSVPPSPQVAQEEKQEGEPATTGTTEGLAISMAGLLVPALVPSELKPVPEEDEHAPVTPAEQPASVTAVAEEEPVPTVVEDAPAASSPAQTAASATPYLASLASLTESESDSDETADAASIGSVAIEEMQDVLAQADMRCTNAMSLMATFGSPSMSVAEMLLITMSTPLVSSMPTEPSIAAAATSSASTSESCAAPSSSSEPAATVTAVLGDDATLKLVKDEPKASTSNALGIGNIVNVDNKPAEAAKAVEEDSGVSDNESGSYVSTADETVPQPVKIAVAPAPAAKPQEPSALDLLLLASVIEEHRPAIGENSPVMTQDALNQLGVGHSRSHALFGTVLKQEAADFKSKTKDPRLLLHYDTPFTAVICGVQGSGKSHSTSVILENCLMNNSSDDPAGAVSGLVLHFENVGSGAAILPCEAAYLANSDPQFGQAPVEVTVFVSPNCIGRMRQVYSKISGVKVEPFFLTPDDLDVVSMLSIMQLESGENVPLYMASVMSILMEISNNFTLDRFYEKINHLRRSLQPIQDAMLQQRIGLLKRTVNPKGKSIKAALKPGTLVILDLSDPFIDAGQASSIFEIVLGLHMGKPGSKIVALDEAHKYIKGTTSAKRLTSSLLSIVRQQRHLGARVVVSTQEPTVVPPEILDLASFVMVHRFSSPAWGKHLASHVGGAVAKARRDHDDDRTNSSSSSMPWFDKAVALNTGEALLFAPSGLALRRDGKPGALGTGHMLMRTRRRITSDGGKTILASHKPVAIAIEPPRPPTPPADNYGGW